MSSLSAERNRSRREGIAAGGNWLVDLVKTVDQWPAQDGLALIAAQVPANGGGPYNVLVDLSQLGVKYPLSGIGLLGDDENGRFILRDCRRRGIQCRHLRSLPGIATSYSDVITVASSGRRTFFHHCGANARLGPEHFDFRKLKARHFHLGYLMLLDRLDQPGKDGRAQAAEVLARARAEGLSTSVDCVSSSAPGFASTVLPLLSEVDVLFTNDYEAERLTGLELGRGDALRPALVLEAAQGLLKAGVRRWVILHFPEGVLGLTRAGEFCFQPSLAVPQENIVGAAGAGDALAAGVLHGFHEGWSLERSLGLGVCVAASCLAHSTCSGGIGSLRSCLSLGRRYGYRSQELFAEVLEEARRGRLSQSASERLSSAAMPKTF